MRFQRVFVWIVCFVLSSSVMVGQTAKHTRLNSVNSIYDEQNLVVDPSGNRIYFTRSGHPQNVGGIRDKGDIWYVEKTDSAGWSEPKHAGSLINHQGLDGVAGISRGGKTIYLLNHGKGASLQARKGISKSSWEQGGWSEPVEVPIRYFSNRSAHIDAFISPDEKVMILSIQSYQTYGNEDLYVSFNQGNGQWSQPLNLGAQLNTPGEEWSPYLSPDTKTIYFSSNGHEGFGSRDIFMAKRLDETWTQWSKPENLGAAVNTKGAELGYFIPSGKDFAFLSSTQNSEGFGDIFSVPLNELIPAVAPVRDTVVEIEVPETVVETVEPEREVLPSLIALHAKVVDVNTNEPIPAKLVFDHGAKQKIIRTSDSQDHLKVSFANGEEVDMRIEAAGYLKYQEKFVVSDSINVERVFKLVPEKVGTKVAIGNVLFKRGLPLFADSLSAQKELDKLVALMSTNPVMEIRLEGHTDGRGVAELNQKLSEARVAYIKQYLTSQGIVGERIETIGYGGSRPIASNNLESSRMLNRRVEFVVTKSGKE